MTSPIEYQDAQGTRHVQLQGDLDAELAGSLWRVLSAAAQSAALHEIRVDLAQVRMLSSAGAAVLARSYQVCQERAMTLRLVHGKPQHHATLRLFSWPPPEPSEVASESGLSWLGSKGEAVVTGTAALRGLLSDLGKFGMLALLRRERMPRGSLVRQCVVYGIDALPILGLLSFLMGIILTFQASYQLRQFGANVYAVDLVAISMVREFSPMLAGIILAGRSGAAMAAELGTMVVQEELDALRTMGIHPVRYLVLPRLLGLILTQPALTLISDFIGILGGYVIAASALDIPHAVYVQRTLDVVGFDDWVHGITKSVVYAALVAAAGCFYGVNAGKGSSEVGRAATRAVVAGIFLIIVADSAFAVVTTLTKR